MHKEIQKLTDGLISFLVKRLEMEHDLAEKMGGFLTLLLLILVSIIAYRLTIKLLKIVVIPILHRSKNQFDDLLLKNNFFRNVAFLIPALLLYYFTQDTISSIPILIKIVKSILKVLYIIIILGILSSVLDTINDYYDRYNFAKDHPIKPAIQIIKIIFYVIGLIAIVAVLFNKDLSSLVFSLGAASAVLMLIFKDPILGFVGGLQLIFNKMLAIDDWITMPKYGADGSVLEINLTTVKIQNWDKTIITIPTYSLISDSFQNWKGMEESGGRRIKRAIFIDMNSIRFCTPDMLNRFKQIQVLGDYITKTEKQIEEFNSLHNIDPEILVNGRRQTNIGVFRAYLEAYLKRRSDVNQKLTFMVRQLAPSEKGLPIEIYVFASTTQWVEYEGIQSDIFDHVLAVVPQFDLKIYQYPTDKYPVA